LRLAVQGDERVQGRYDFLDKEQPFSYDDSLAKGNSYQETSTPVKRFFAPSAARHLNTNRYCQKQTDNFLRLIII